MSGNFRENKTPVEGRKQPLLESQLNLEHPLVKLAKALDWQYFEEEFKTATTTDVGRPALSSRLLVGLHYLKALYDESDESVVEKWVENPYWQYFCGETTFQHELPCHPTSLVKWRQRVGAQGVEKLLKGVLKSAFEQQALKASEIKKVNVDTTVQEKAIAFPTDARLYDKARRALVRAAHKQQIKLRQNYSRLGKQTLFRQSRYAMAQQGGRARKQTQKLRTYLGRVIRDIERKLPNPSPASCFPTQGDRNALASPMLASLLQRAKRIYQQKRHDSGKLYSVHAPEVECIAKGKVNKKYEFGCKVAVVTTHCSNWIVGIDAQHGNPYDGATLAPALVQVENLTHVKPQQAFVDQGFRGSTHHPQGVQVLIAGSRKRSGFIKQLLKRRSAIEPVIGHTKHDHRMQRNYLQGQVGDRINSFLAGCGFNLRKLYRFFMTAPLLHFVV